MLGRLLLLSALWAFFGVPQLGRASRVDTDRVVGQIVVVYSPKSDYNGAFVTLGEDMSALLDAAREKKMKVVFYRADGTQSTDGLKDQIKSLVGSRPSWVVLATHGGPVHVGGEGTEVIDTGLSFSGGIKVSELSDSIRGAQGITVYACHSFTKALQFKGRASCATSAGDRESYSASGTLVFNALADLMRTREPVEPGAFLEAKIKTAIEGSDSWTQKIFRGADGKTVVPVFHEDTSRYRFEGQKFETIDERGRPITFCATNRIGAFSDLLPFGLYRAAQVLPGKYGPSEGVHPNSTTFECRADGSWRIRMPEFCSGVTVRLSDCDKPVPRPGAQVVFLGKTNSGWWTRECKRVAERIRRAQVDGIYFDDPICVAGCTDLPSPRFSARVFVTAPGACDPGGRGQRCGFHLGDFHSTELANECCGTGAPRSYALDASGRCQPKCFDVKKRQIVKDGQCLTSEIPILLTPDGAPFADADPIFACAYGAPGITADCCNAVPGRLFDSRSGNCGYGSAKAHAPEDATHGVTR